MQIVILAGGVGGSKFVAGARRAYPEAQITVVVNTADDITMHGLRICPDLDTMMYTLGEASDQIRGWGRAGETWRVKDELAAYGVEPSWFGLGDLDIATHLVRTQMLDAGYPLSEVTKALCARWLAADPALHLVPMSNDRVETHIVIDDPEAPGGRRAVHFQEYWVRLHAEPRVRDVIVVGLERAQPAPGVLEAVAEADVVLLPPSNPVVSVGTVLGVPGIREALRAGSAPVVGLSPVIAGAAVRGMADQLLSGLGREGTAAGIARAYGARASGGILDGWLVDTADAACVPDLEAAGIRARSVPLLMHDAEATAAMARSALELAAQATAA